MTAAAEQTAPEAPLADFAYACAMLKATPRSGYAFLGSGSETVAEHSYGVAMLGFVLARMASADVDKTIRLCLFHDLHEAVTGDLNYVNHRFDTCDAQAALAEICRGTGLEDEIAAMCREFESRGSQEAILARDADQIDFIISLRKQLAAGNNVAAEWLKTAVLRVKSEPGQKLCQAIMNTDPAHWWYGQADKAWWTDRIKT